MSCLVSTQINIKLKRSASFSLAFLSELLPILMPHAPMVDGVPVCHSRCTKVKQLSLYFNLFLKFVCRKAQSGSQFVFEAQRTSTSFF